MAAVTISTGDKVAYYSSGTVGWSARSLFAYRTAIQQLTAATTVNWGNAASASSIAQSFTPGANMDVSDVRVILDKVLAPTDDVSLAIWSDSSNLPNAVIDTADNLYNGANISTTASWGEFHFNTAVSLTSGTKYWIVLARSGAVDASNYYTMVVNNGSAYAGGGTSILNAGTWGAESATNDFAFQILTESPSALYAITQSTEPALHAWKSTDDGATWTEQDTSNNPTVTNAVYPYDACDTRSGPYLGTAFLTAANTMRVRLFDMSTDTWGSDLGAADAATNVQNERSLRLTLDNTFVSAACGTQLIFHTDSATDDADLHHARRTTTTWSSANLIVGGTSGEASLVADVVMDKAPIGYNQRFFYDVANDDFSYRSWTGTSGGTQGDIDAIAAATEASHASATYQIYQASNVDKVVAAYIDSDDSIEEVTALLEVTSASITLGTQHAVGTATTSAGRQLSTCEYGGDLYVAANVSGTGITYYIDAGGAGSWDSGTSFKSGLTDCTLSQIINVPTIGLAVIYTDNGDAKIDWIDGGPVSDVTVNGSLSTASALANSGSLFNDLTGSLATATALANDGTVRTGFHVDGSLATADALMNSGTIAIDIQGSNAVTTSALAFSGTLSIKPATSLATASALAFDGTVALDIPGSLALASALANASTTATDIVGVTGTASAEAFAGTVAVGTTIQGSLATATAQAFDGTTQESGEISEGDRYRFFQVRPLPTGY
jgi:hypothetical protein